MPEIVRREPELATGLARWDPFRMMDEFMKRELGTFGWPLVERMGYSPRFDVKETKEAYHFKADLPGVKESDLDLSLTGNRLTISGKREEEERKQGEQYYTYERSYGSFSRTFTLPEDCNLEHLDAELKNGVLSVVVAKKTEAQPRKISLKGLKEKITGAIKA